MFAPKEAAPAIRPAKKHLQMVRLNQREEPLLKYKCTGIAVAFAALFSIGSAHADKLKVGVLATLEGPYTVLGEDAMRGFDLAVMQHHNKAGGKDLEIIRGSSDASPDSALRAAKKLVEQDKVDVFIGPLSGSEGIALRDYAKTQPQITIINGSSGALETTYVTPAPNYFRFNIDGAQMQKGTRRIHLQCQALQKDRDGR